MTEHQTKFGRVNHSGKTTASAWSADFYYISVVFRYSSAALKINLMTKPKRKRKKKEKLQQDPYNHTRALRGKIIFSIAERTALLNFKTNLEKHNIIHIKLRI